MLGIHRIKKQKSAIFEQLKIDEGVVANATIAPCPTFGVGHLIESDPIREPVGTSVSEEECGRVLTETLKLPSQNGHLYGEREFGDLPAEVQQILI